MRLEDQLALITRLVYRANKHTKDKNFLFVQDHLYVSLVYYNNKEGEDYSEEVKLDPDSNPTVPLSTWIEILKKYSPEENVH